MATTLLQLRDRCKEESDNVGQSFLSDPEWTKLINASASDLYGQIVQCFGNDYFTQAPTTGFTITTDGINQYFALPTDIFKLLGVDLRVSSPNYWVTLKPFALAERNKFSLMNNLIPMAGQTLRLLYVPRMTPLVADADTMDGVNGWEEFVVIDACIKALAKEESDVSVFMARRQAMEARLQSEIENRDAGSAATIVDLTGNRTRAMQYRLNGNNLWLIGNGMPGWGPWGDWGGSGMDGGFW